MKKFKKMMMLCLCTTLATAQPYFEKTYPHTGTFFSSATVAKNVANPGFMMAGYAQTNIVGNPNFYIDKTDTQGDFSGGGFFPNEYKIYKDAACGVNPPQSTNCFGVSIIETTSLTDPYALAGAVLDGCFYASLDNGGMPMQKMFYPFPSGAFSITKPLIMEHPTAGQGLIICGSYSLTGQGRRMYLLSIDPMGNILQSYVYHCGLGLQPPCQVPHGQELNPKAIIESPYNQPNGAKVLVIVGEASWFTAAVCLGGPVPAHSSGFFLRLDLASLNWLTNTLYNYQFGSPQGPTAQTNFFNAITPSNNISSGFTLGGFTTMGLANNSWIVKIDPLGNLIRSHILSSSYDPNTKAITGVVERFSSVYGIYTTFATARSSVGMLCYKLDDMLQPFTSLTPVDDYNEFLYATGGSSNAQAITFDDAGLTWGQGIHVYGSQTGSNYLAAAAFNGYTEFSTCSSSAHNNLATFIQGPPISANNAVNRLPGLSMCGNFNLTGVNVIITPNTLCSVVNMPASGSNNRTTGIGSNTADNNELSIYPNPVTGVARISYTGMQGASFELYNNLGQRISLVNTMDSETKEVEIDFKKLDLEPGVYYIKATVNGKVMQQKLVYTGK